MRKIKIFLVWSLIGVIIEAATFTYIDNSYFKATLSLKEEKVDNTKETKKAVVTIPDKASDLKCSDDGNYVSYFEGNILKVVNTYTGALNAVEASQNTQVCYCKWLPDDSMIVAEKDVKSIKNQYITFYSYNAENDSKKELVDYNTKTLKVSLINKTDSVDQIAFSTQNHVMYIKVLRKGNRSDIYSINIMNQIHKEKTATQSIGNIAMLYHDTTFIYDEPAYNKVRVLGKSAPITISGVKSPRLLATDNNDRVYIGSVEGNKITRIFHGGVKNAAEKWITVKLNEPTESKNISITKNGSIYINNPVKGYVTDTSSNAQVKYSGRFIGVYDKGILSLNDGKITFTNF